MGVTTQAPTFRTLLEAYVKVQVLASLTPIGPLAGSLQEI